MSRAANMPDTARSEPTERSMPPAMMTIVTPMDMMAMVDMPRSTLKMFRGRRKYGLARVMMTISATSASRTPASRRSKMRPTPLVLDWQG